LVVVGGRDLVTLSNPLTGVLTASLVVVGLEATDELLIVLDGKLELVDDVGGTVDDDEGFEPPPPFHGPPVTGSRYQFADGSPRHSPSVTNSNFPRAWSIIHWRKPFTVNSWMSCARTMKEEDPGVADAIAALKISLEATPPFSQSLESRL
jgi:hypothetical protein